jgi:hypothetical protein
MLIFLPEEESVTHHSQEPPAHVFAGAFFYGCNGETSLQPKGVISIGTVFRKKGDAEPSPVSLPLPVTDADLSCWGQDSCRYKENRINTSYFAIYRLEESSGYGSETL